MSLVSGLPNIKIPFVIPITSPQPVGTWSGNNTVFTTLNRGTYWLNWSPRINPIANTTGDNKITQFQLALSINQPFGVAGNTILATSPLCGLIGQQTNQPVTWTLSNIFTITADNTPVYVYINIIMAVTPTANTWYMGVSNDIANLDDIDFTRIA